jgi:hypothetical protein
VGRAVYAVASRCPSFAVGKLRSLRLRTAAVMCVPFVRSWYAEFIVGEKRPLRIPKRGFIRRDFYC